MKKIFITFLTLILTLTFTACTGNISEVNLNPNQQNKPSESPNENAKVNYTLITTTDKLPEEIQNAIEAKEDKHYSFVVKGEGKSQYVYIQLGMRNTAGYDINILRVENVDGKISVIYEEIRPEPEAVVAQVITYPWIALKIDSDLPITVREKITSEQEAPDSEIKG